MIGIGMVASYIPNKRRDNSERLQAHGVDQSFLDKKIGIQSVARKEKAESSSDLCVEAWRLLCGKQGAPNAEEVDCICVCTQTPDFPVPHVSAIVHGKLGLRKDCAVFDISQGCAGYVYSISVMKGFMNDNGFNTGLLFTCDPYSEIVAEEDRNTDLLFGDAATVTLMTDEAVFDLGVTSYYTDGSMHDALIKRENEPLSMDGRKIFNFVMGNVPANVAACLGKNDLDSNSIDVFLMHQASLYMVETLTKQLRVGRDRVPFEMGEYGNTVSSSIPILLEREMEFGNSNTVLISGYGVGLCSASTVLRRR